MGYIPVSPLDFNEIGEKELTNHTEIQMTAWYMGRDIDLIIRKCDAIYCCEGWENSKGCNVERECAKQYNRDIFYQTPYDTRKDATFLNTVFNKRCNIVDSLLVSYNQNDKDCYKYCSIQLEEFDKFMENHFGLKYNKEKVEYTRSDSEYSDMRDKLVKKYVD